MLSSPEGKPVAWAIESLMPVVKMCIESSDDEIKKWGLLCAFTIRLLPSNRKFREISLKIISVFYHFFIYRNTLLFFFRTWSLFKIIKLKFQII